MKHLQHFFGRVWAEDDGVLSFEWTVLASLLTVGVVSGIASVRDATIDEMGDLAQAMVSLDQSYCIAAPLGVEVHTGTAWGWGWGWGYGTSGASDSAFVDAYSYADCHRVRPLMKVQEFPRTAPVPPAGPPPVVEPAPAL